MPLDHCTRWTQGDLYTPQSLRTIVNAAVTPCWEIHIWNLIILHSDPQVAAVRDDKNQIICQRWLRWVTEWPAQARHVSPFVWMFLKIKTTLLLFLATTHTQKLLQKYWQSCFGWRNLISFWPNHEHSRFQIHTWFLYPYHRLELPKPPISVSKRVHLYYRPGLGGSWGLLVLSYQSELFVPFPQKLEYVI